METQEKIIGPWTSPQPPAPLAIGHLRNIRRRGCCGGTCEPVEVIDLTVRVSAAATSADRAAAVDAFRREHVRLVALLATSPSPLH